MKSIDPDLVVMQLDIGNLFDGGAVALDVVNRYPGRFENVHVKDVKKSDETGKYESVIIGEGVADVRKVIDTHKKHRRRTGNDYRAGIISGKDTNGMCEERS